jgi:DNA-directed RNA polymerase specialized sigma24 family protein
VVGLSGYAYAKISDIPLAGKGATIGRWTEEMRARDAEVARLIRAGVSYRAVAARLGCSLGSVQKSLARTKQRVAEKRSSRG